MSIIEWKDKQNVVYTYNGILFSLQKEGNPFMCHNVDETWGCHTKRNKPFKKDKFCVILLKWYS